MTLLNPHLPLLPPVVWHERDDPGTSLLSWMTRSYALTAKRTVAAVSTSGRNLDNGEEVELTARTAKVEQELAIAHSGAQTAMVWREQVLRLHDRGLEPEEIRWVMCCEDGGTGHEEWNGIIDEVIGNVPRVPPPGMVELGTRSSHRRLPRPRGRMRADLDQNYGFPAGHHNDGAMTAGG